MSMKIALDLFCKAGGASDGLAAAGYTVVGVDIEDQDNYPYQFIKADAISFLEAMITIGSSVDLIWASPPCQGFTAYRRNGKVKDYPNYIPKLRSLLSSINCNWVIENVEGAPLENAVTLCGSMFGLDVKRHRVFESNFVIAPMSCNHGLWKPRFPPASNRSNLRKTVEVGVYRIPIEIQKRAMGISRKVTLKELSNAIPPVYSKYIGQCAQQ